MLACLRSSRRADFRSSRWRNRKKFKNQTFSRCAWLLGIIQIQRSFNLQVFLSTRNVWTDFFHVIQRILQQAAPGQRSRAGRALDGGSYCGQPNGLALAEDCTHEIHVLRLRFFNFFLQSFSTHFVLFFFFSCKHYVTVRNTNYYLCFSHFEIECVCFVFFV